MAVALPAVAQAHPTDIVVGMANPDGSPSTSGLTPTQVRVAYGMDAYNNSGVLGNAIAFRGIQGDGTGQTIAIVDAYDDPSALGDLTQFSSTYNLPQFNSAGLPTFQKLNQSGGTSLPSTDPAGEYNGSNNDWEIEESLDIEWAHAMAPMANIILVEANSDGNSDLFQAAQTAAGQLGVVAVSMSWGMPELPGETNTDSTDFTTPSGHLGGATSTPVYSTALVEAGNTVTFTAANTFTTGESVTIAGAAPAGFNGTHTILSATASGFTYTDTTSGLGTATTQATAAIDLAGGVTFLTSAGDSGAYTSSTSIITPQYPATSPNVVAVGGTSLTVNENSSNEYSYGGETSWGNGVSSGTLGGGGGGISSYESQPSYQSSAANAYSATQRTYPDVSADAESSVLIYDSYVTSGYGPWLKVTGTSVACPLWAGMIAVADQGRAIAGLGSLDGPSQTLPELYSLAASNSYSADFNDITTGNSIGPTTGSPSYFPGTSYDLATGLGSPKAAALIPQLAVGLANTLAIAQGPSSAAAGASITPAIIVDVENAAGQIVTADNSSVTISIGSNPSNGLLLGTRTVAAVNGVATFTGLSIDTAGKGYTLVASDGGLATATSAAFNITANSAQPTLSTPASTPLNPVSGKTASLSVLGADPQGETLTYTWSAVSLPSGAASPTFSPTNAAQNTTANFSSAGTYVFLVTITDSSGLSKGSTVSVTVNQTLTSLRMTPGSVVLSTQSQQQFTAALDQFGNTMPTPPSMTWTAASGTITSSGLYTPPSSAGSDTITAQSGSLKATASVTIVAPAGWWKLNGTATDSSSNGDTGTITMGNGAWLQSPPALQFDGSSTVVKLGSSTALNISGQITLSAWIKPASISQTMDVVDLYASGNIFVVLGITSGGDYQVSVRDGLTVRGGTSAAIPTQDLNSWVHLAATYDGTTWRLYRDGQQIASSASSQGAFNPSGGTWSIGAATSSLLGTTTSYFKGAIDDVRIYSVAISAAAISGLEAFPPTVTTAAAATLNTATGTVTGTNTTLSVQAADDYPVVDPTLTYTWATTGTPPAPVIFSAVNGTNAASNLTATFSAAGTYNFQVTIANPGVSATSSVGVTVSQTLTSINLTTGQQPFVATAFDQFGAALANQPTFNWSLLDSPGLTVNLDGVSASVADVTLGGSTIAQQGSGGTLQLASGATLTVAANSAATISAPVALGGNATLSPDAGSKLTISGGVSGAGESLTVDNSGTVVLGGADSYTGGTTVSAGTLILTNSSAIAANTGLTVGAGGTVIIGPPVAASGNVATPSSASVSNSAGDSLVQSSATVATPPIAGASSDVSAVTAATSAATSNDTSATSAVSHATSAAAASNTSLATPPAVLPLPASPPAPQTNKLGKSHSIPSPIASHDFSAGPDVVNKSAVGNLPSPIVPPVAVQPPQSVPAGASGTPAASQIARSSIAKGLFQDAPRRTLSKLFAAEGQGSRSAGDLAWLGQAVNSSDSSDPNRKKSAEILALDAVFAQYR